MNLKLPDRTQKPRSEGLTFISDTGLTCAELGAVLDDYHELIDFAQLGVGSAFVTPRLDEKLELYRECGVTTYFGGTLFEKFHHQAMISDYLKYLRDHGIEWIEVSSGTIDSSLHERCEIVNSLKDEFNVIAEVGCKDTTTIMSPSEWINELQSLIESGASYVVTEGRDSGSAGIFRPSGEIREGLVADILSNVSLSKLVFEAPTQSA